MNIEEWLTDGDFVPLKLRARTGNGDEEEDMAEEQDDDTHESPTSQDQKAMSLFYCPVKGCMKTFLRSSTLQHRMIHEHINPIKKKSMKEQNRGTPNALKKVLMQILRCKQSLRYFKAKTI